MNENFLWIAIVFPWISFKIYQSYEKLKSENKKLYKEKNIAEEQFNNLVSENKRRDRLFQIEKNELQKQIDKEKEQFNDLLKFAGVKSSEFNYIVSSDTHRFNLHSETKAAKYLQKILENYKKRDQYIKQKPIVSATSLLFKDKIVEAKKVSLKERIEIYKQECIELQKQNDWFKPNISSSVFEDCKITDIIDGDTFRVFLEKQNVTYKVRTIGFDCPETCHPRKSVGHYGLKATHFAEKLISNSSSVKIRLDKEHEKQGWFFDRYGRLLAHIEVDGILLGISMLESGHAECIEMFPIENEILKNYEVSEAKAKFDSIGMWKELNEIEQRKKARFQTLKSFSVMNEILDSEEENRKLKELYRAEVKISLSDLIGSTMVKSNNSIIVHSPDCKYVDRIYNKTSTEITEEMLTTVKACKVCGGNAIVDELNS
jgi:micrococcal nuclease